jgi:hypothetical protein
MDLNKKYIRAKRNKLKRGITLQTIILGLSVLLKWQLYMTINMYRKLE